MEIRPAKPGASDIRPKIGCTGHVALASRDATSSSSDSCSATSAAKSPGQVPPSPCSISGRVRIPAGHRTGGRARSTSRPCAAACSSPARTTFCRVAIRHASFRWHTIWCADIFPHRAGCVRPQCPQALQNLGPVALSGQRLHRASRTQQPLAAGVAERRQRARRGPLASARSGLKRRVRRAARRTAGSRSSVGATKYPWTTARSQARQARLVLADVAEQPSLLEDGLGVVAESSALPMSHRCPRARRRAPIEPGRADSRSTIWNAGYAASRAHPRSRSRASSRRPARPSPMTRMPSSAPATTAGGRRPACGRCRRPSAASARSWSGCSDRGGALRRARPSDCS